MAGDSGKRYGGWRFTAIVTPQGSFSYYSGNCQMCVSVKGSVRCRGGDYCRLALSNVLVLGKNDEEKDIRACAPLWGSGATKLGLNAGNGSLSLSPVELAVPLHS